VSLTETIDASNSSDTFHHPAVYTYDFGAGTINEFSYSLNCDTISGGFFYDQMVSEGLTDSAWVMFGGAETDGLWPHNDNSSGSTEDSNYWEASLFAYAIDLDYPHGNCAPGHSMSMYNNWHTGY
jgi:hypothetical protein